VGPRHWHERLCIKDEIKEMLKRVAARLERSADVGSHVAAARRPTQKPALDKRLEERVARFRFQVPQALCLTLGERQAGHLEVLASNPLHDRVNRVSLHTVSAADLDSMSVNWPSFSCQMSTPAARA
jgi:hypothetical protein